jgi:TPR repeat protein
MTKNIPIMIEIFFRKKIILKKFSASLLFIALFIFCPANALADFEDGLFASHKGDYLTAFREFRSLAETGHTKAQVQLGIMYEMGLGVKRDYTEASKWSQKAAIQGDKDAQKRLLGMRKKGLSTTFQPPIPDSWQGNTTEPQSQYDIGVMYFKGIGVEKNYAIAYRWFYMAANQGHARAQNDMAVLLSKGLGVRQNKPEAYVWFIRAAEQGFADSQYNLGVMLSSRSGSGMPQHFILAYMWFEIAAQNGILEARNNQVRLAPKMTETQLEEAKSQARKWLAKHK